MKKPIPIDPLERADYYLAEAEKYGRRVDWLLKWVLLPTAIIWFLLQILILIARLTYAS